MKYLYVPPVSKITRSGVIALCVLGSSLMVSAQNMGQSGFDLSKVFQALKDRGAYTMIPRGSVIHVPKGMKSKLGRPDHGSLVSLDQFIRQNSVWLHKMPVTLAEAQGKVPIDPIRLERVAKLGKVVIAVHKGKVITVKKIEEPIANIE